MYPQLAYAPDKCCLICGVKFVRLQSNSPDFRFIAVVDKIKAIQGSIISFAVKNHQL